MVEVQVGEYDVRYLLRRNTSFSQFIFQIGQVEEVVIAELADVFVSCTVVDKDYFSGAFDISRLLIERMQPFVSLLG